MKPSILLFAAAFAAFCVHAAASAGSQLTVRAHDWLRMPASGNLELEDEQQAGGPSYIARTNFMRPEPGGTGRIWINDSNGNLYILPVGGDFADRNAALEAMAAAGTPYMDFNGSTSGREGDVTFRPVDDTTVPVTPDGIFRRFTKFRGYAAGLITFEFDPEFTENGRFYTVHMESSTGNTDERRIPLGGPGTKHPGLDTAGWESTPTLTSAVGGNQWHSVLIEWTTPDPTTPVFEGIGREILRLGFNLHIHPLGDITFNPLATEPSHPDWGVMYLAIGDGGSGESAASDNRTLLPQRLDSHVGKIFRIIPDLSRQTETSTVSGNGRYRVPDDNPFVDISGARPEIWTLGHRNPHRFAWDIPTGTLLNSEIGQREWEEVNIIERGLNYGYAEREGPERLLIVSGPDNQTTVAVPDPDEIPVRLNATQTLGTVTPTYPVIAYPHTEAFGGDAIANGYVYRGTAIPELVGKFVLGDITTGRLYYADFGEMLAAHANNSPESPVDLQPLHIEWTNPYDDSGTAVYPDMFDIVKAAYHARGGADVDLPGSSRISGSGRADIRFAIDDAGELYIISKSDGMIRGLTAPPQKDAWLADHFDESERAIPEIAGDLADPDDDGIPNLLEYALGLSPRENSAAAIPPVEAVDGRPAFRYTPLRPELLYTAEASRDLVNWSDNDIEQTLEPDGTVRAEYTGPDPEAVFLRLSVRPRFQ
ncbi:MAG: PQQ-dependent sugar dehydrogenase [Opitutales bacterium]|nr:PQQ-dependent sugar dehydrogenase [Opitutales bacterium]